MVTSPAVRMQGITKDFSGVRVLDGVDFELARGEIHALIGGNGAGKSTLMKILEGVYAPDAGVIEVDGKTVQFHTSLDARLAGVTMIFQEFSLIPTLSAAQNVYLGRERRGHLGLIDDREAERRTRVLFASLGIEIDPRRAVDDLSTAYRQLTEIAKALSQDARILIMDEPTASLARAETEQLFTLMRRLRERGISIVYISHRLEEVFEVADRITVLRDGRNVATRAAAVTTMQEAIDAIVGSKIEKVLEWQERELDPEAPVLLELRGLVSGEKLRGIDLTLHAGEIIGLAGLMGSGRSELLRVAFGIDPVAAGEIIVRGRPVSIGAPQDAIALGLGLIPEDRHYQGLVLDHSVRQNLLLPLLARLSRRGVVDDGAGTRITERFVRDLQIRSRSIHQPVRLLSGGNQQKVVLGKWLATEPQILFMDEATAGVDIRTKGEIVDMVRRFAAAGNGVIFVSSELAELLAVSDRILILRDGSVARELPRSEIRAEEDLHHAVQALPA